MIQVIITLFLCWLVYFVNKIYFRPKAMLKYYQKQFSSNGYRVHILPFRYFIDSFIFQMFKDTKKGDAFKSIKEQYCKYDLILTTLKNSPRMIFINPELIKHFSIAETDFVLTKTPYARKAFSNLASGLLFSEKQMWKRRRKIISHVFTYQFISSFSIRIADIFDEALNDCENASKQITQNQYYLEPLDYTSSATSNVILECFLGSKSRNLQISNMKINKFLIKLLDDFVEQLIDPISVFLGPQIIDLGIRNKDRNLAKRIKAFNEWSFNFIGNKIHNLNKEIDDLESEKSNDLIEAIIIENKKNKEVTYSPEEIIDQFKLFLVAGTDTTSHFLQVMIYYLTRHPLIFQKVKQEAMEFPKREDFQMERLKNTRYIDAVIKETTRIYGPANFSLLRYSEKDFLLGQIPIKKGTYMSQMSMCLHYSKQYYKNPQEFRPERWLNGQCDTLDPYAFVGFHAGSRSCIGRQLALLEAKIGLIKFVERYKSLSCEKEINFYFKFAYVCQNFKVHVSKRNC